MKECTVINASIVTASCDHAWWNARPLQSVTRRFVILENVPIGVCDTCGYRYYHSSLLRQVEEIAARRRPAERIDQFRLPRLRELPTGDDPAL